MMHGFRGFGMGFGWFGLIFFVIILGVIIWFISSILRNSTIKNIERQDGFLNRGKTPLDILEERYAKGEIDDEEFEKRKRLLTGKG